jgi:molybdopterin synthase sulfur carrier subunit
MNITLHISLRYFASIREMVGVGQETWRTQASTVAELRQELVARGGGYAQALGSDRALRAALDQDLCEGSTPLHEGCEVAFFPPVTGG